MMILKVNEIFDLTHKTNSSKFTKSFINQHKGNIPVYIFYEGTKKMKLLSRNIWLNDSEDTIYKLNIAFGSDNVKIV